MPSHSRELTVLGLLGATLWLPQCSQLTKVDWGLIQPAGGMTSSGGSAGTSGSAGTTGGLAGENNEAGEGGVGTAGEAGAGGEAAVGDTGGAGASAGFGAGGAGMGGNSGGTGGTLGGTGGGAGSAGSAGALIQHPTCETAPPTPTTPPDLTGKIIFFDGGPGTNGNRGGRGSSVPPLSGLDGACATAKAALHLPGSEVHAVISVAQNDAIFDMPRNYGLPKHAKPVVSPLGISLAQDWYAIWTKAQTPSLVCSGVMPVGVKTWLTGTSLSKQPDPLESVNDTYYGFASGLVGGENNTCNGWTAGNLDSAVRAQVGSAIASNDTDAPPFFINRFVTSCDAATSNILCATYDP